MFDGRPSAESIPITSSTPAIRGEGASSLATTRPNAVRSPISFYGAIPTVAFAPVPEFPSGCRLPSGQMRGHLASPPTMEQSPPPSCEVPGGG